MNQVETVEKMKSLRLLGMLNAFQVSQEMNQNWTTDEMIAYLIQAEWEYRINKKIERHLKSAKFRYQASIEEIDFQHPRNLDRNKIHQLAQCNYLSKKENIILTGPTGVGKSFLASALGNQACLKGFKVLYFNISKLFAEIKMSKLNNTYHRLITRIEKHDLLILVLIQSHPVSKSSSIEKHDLLILDDFGLVPFDIDNRLALLEIIEDRHGRKSTMISSQLPVSKWHPILGDPTIADAILDRLVHQAIRIELEGESLRKKKIKSE